MTDLSPQVSLTTQKKPKLSEQPIHEVHTSERKSFRACRWRWSWIFRENFYPKVTAKPLEFGTAYHKALESFYNPQTWHLTSDDTGRLALMNSAIKIFDAECDAQLANFLRVAEENGIVHYDINAYGSLNEQAQAEYDERKELGMGMLRYHLGYVSKIEDRHWTPKKVEIPFRVPILNPDAINKETGRAEQLWCRNKLCNQHLGVEAPVYFAGRIDCLGEDDRGDLWLIDWKTTSQIHKEFHRFLYLDDQVASYVLAMRMMGIKVMGFVYHEQLKAYPKEPKMNLKPRSGRMLSVDKTQPTTFDLYQRTAIREDFEAFQAGLYDEHLMWLKEKGMEFYQRIQIPKSTAELQTVQKNLFLEAQEMVDPKLNMYPSTGRFGCETCAFIDPCMERFAQRDYEYTLESLFDKRENHYWHREHGATLQPSTESKGGE